MKSSSLVLVLLEVVLAVLEVVLEVVLVVLELVPSSEIFGVNWNEIFGVRSPLILKHPNTPPEAPKSFSKIIPAMAHELVSVAFQES